MIAALQAQRDEVDEQIAQLTTTHEEFSIAAELEKMTGFGKVTAATLASRLAWSLHKHRTLYDPNRVYQQNQSINS